MLLSEFVHKIGFDIDFAKLNKLNDDIKASRQLAKEVFQGFSDITSGMEKFGKKLSLFVSLPLFGMAGASLKAAADQEQLTLRLQQAAGAGVDLTGVVTDLEKALRKTPFNDEQLYGFATQLARVKVPLKEIAPLIEKVGNITGGDAGRAFEIIGAIQRGKMFGSFDRRSLRMLGPEIITELQKGMSPTAFAAQLKQGISIETVLASIDQVAKRRSSYMIEQVNSLTGIIGALAKVIEELGEEIGFMLIHDFKIKSVLKFVINSLWSLLDIVKKIPAPLRILVFSFLGIVAALGPLLVLIGGGAGLLVQIPILITQLGLLGITLGTVGTAFSTFFYVISPWLVGIAAVASALYLLWDDIDVWRKGGVSITGEFLGPWKDWKDSMIEFFQMVGDAWDWLMTKWTPSHLKEKLEGIKFFTKVLNEYTGNTGFKPLDWLSKAIDDPWSVLGVKGNASPATGTGISGGVHISINGVGTPGSAIADSSGIGEAVQNEVNKYMYNQKMAVTR